MQPGIEKVHRLKHVAGLAFRIVARALVTLAILIICFLLFDPLAHKIWNEITSYLRRP